MTPPPGQEYTNEEDFFFRTIHLGTECWMFIANSRARSARQAAGQAAWHVASARIMQVGDSALAGWLIGYMKHHGAALFGELDVAICDHGNCMLSPSACQTLSYTSDTLLLYLFKTFILLLPQCAHSSCSCSCASTGRPHPPLPG
jgi:hypothetical protein